MWMELKQNAKIKSNMRCIETNLIPEFYIEPAYDKE